MGWASHRREGKAKGKGKPVEGNGKESDVSQREKDRKRQCNIKKKKHIIFYEVHPSIHSFVRSFVRRYDECMVPESRTRSKKTHIGGKVEYNPKKGAYVQARRAKEGGSD